MGDKKCLRTCKEQAAFRLQLHSTIQIKALNQIGVYPTMPKRGGMDFWKEF